MLDIFKLMNYFWPYGMIMLVTTCFVAYVLIRIDEAMFKLEILKTVSKTLNESIKDILKVIETQSSVGQSNNDGLRNRIDILEQKIKDLENGK